jgi:hypothetical protein
MRSEQVNMPWVKSSFSFANGNCVEVAELPGDSVGIRDSRDPGGPFLRFTRTDWAAFLRGVRRGELERFVPGWPEAAPVAGPARHDGRYLPKLSNSPFLTPPRKACHSSDVNLRTGPAEFLLFRTPISPPGRLATSTQLPLA